MATSTTLRPWQYRAIAILIGVTVVVGCALAVGTLPASGQTSADVGQMDITGVNKTVDGDVTAVSLSTDVGYTFDVPDAERRIISLHVGPSEDNLEQVTFRQETDPDGSGSGTVSMSGDVTETDVFAASDFNPELAASETTDVVVQTRIEVRRAGGDPVTATATDTATVRLEDGATLSAGVGGSGDISVSTS